MPQDGESLEEYSKRWVPVIRHSENVRLEGFTLSATHLVVTARADTTTRLFLAPREQLPVQWRRKKPAGITFMEPAGSMKNCTPLACCVPRTIPRLSASPIPHS